MRVLGCSTSRLEKTVPSGAVISMVILSDTLPQKIQHFRDNRLARIVAEEAPVNLRKNPKIILHLLPIEAFQNNSQLDIQSLPPKHRFKKYYNSVTYFHSSRNIMSNKN